MYVSELGILAECSNSSRVIQASLKRPFTRTARLSKILAIGRKYEMIYHHDY